MTKNEAIQHINALHGLDTEIGINCLLVAIDKISIEYLPTNLLVEIANLQLEEEGEFNLVDRVVEEDEDTINPYLLSHTEIERAQLFQNGLLP